MGKYNLLIVEDHALTRFGLRTAFEEEENYNEIFEAPNAKTAFDIIAKTPVDIVIMDLGLPDINGIEAAKKIKEKHSNIKIVVLSSHEKEEDVLNSVKAGANAYCTKDINAPKLKEIVSSVLNGAAWFDPKVAQYVLDAAVSSGENTALPSKSKQTTSNKSQIKESTPEINLTAREKQVLALIVEGLSNIEIAKKLDVSVNTTKAHVCNILQKLSVNDRTQAAIKAIKDNII